MKAFLALQQYEQKKSKHQNLRAENGLIWAMEDLEVFVNCVQDSCTQLTKTSGSKCPAFDLSLTVVPCARISYQCIINATMSLYNIIV